MTAVLLACSSSLWGATTAKLPVTPSRHAATPVIQTAFQKMEQRRAKLAAMAKTGSSDRRLQRDAKRQRFLAEIQKRMPAGGNAQALADALPQASGLSVNFPGFVQGEVHTPGNSLTEPYNTLLALSADVNKDGLPDIVNIQLDGTVNTLLNPGKGKLSSMQLSSVNKSATAQRYVEYATAVDLHNSGYPDVAMLDFGSNTVFVLPNKQDGTFGTATSLVVKFSSGASFQSGGGLAFGDFNGDGKQDMVAYCMTYGYNDSNQPVTSFELLTFPGKGDGTFAAPLPEQYTLLNSFGTTMPGQVAIADTNGDGKLDFTFLAGGFNTGPDQEVYATTLLGDGTGAFSNPSPTLPSSGAIAPGIADGSIVGGLTVQDIDGDGIPDVLFGNCEDPNVYLALGNGDGTYKDATKVITTLGYPGALNFADMNGDGMVDVIAYGFGYTAVFPGTGKGTFRIPRWCSSSPATPGSWSHSPRTLMATAARISPAPMREQISPLSISRPKASLPRHPAWL
jgi:FG-GAP-like repeat